MPSEMVKYGRVMVEYVDPELGATVTRMVPLDEWVGDTPPGADVIQEPSISVDWLRGEENIQVGITLSREVVLGIADYLRGSEDSEYTTYTGLWTRAEVNHLVRTLRRARDASYGSDE